MFPLRRLLSAGLAAALACAAGAASAPARRPLLPQDLWALQRLGSPALSPDGRQVVFTVQEWSVERNQATTQLWLADVAGGAPRRLTTARAADGSPVWSPDGTRIAFTSKRGDDESPALYLLRLDGGEPERMLELPYGVSSPRWLPDGSGLVVITRVLPELAGKLQPADLAALRQEQRRRKESKISAKVTENRTYRYWDAWLTDGLAHKLVRLDLATKALTDLTPGFDRPFSLAGEGGFTLSPDGRTIALSINSTPPPYQANPNQDLYLVPVDGSGTLKNLTPDNPGSDSGPVFAPDGKSLVYRRTRTAVGAGEFAKLWRHELASGANTPLTEAHDYAIDEVVFAPDGGALWVTAEDKGAVGVFRVPAAGGAPQPVLRTGAASGLQAQGGAVVLLHTTASRPDELFALEPATGALRPLTRFNAERLAGIELGRVEEYWFTGAGGDQVHGFLYYPAGYDPARTYPLLQLMHGGPHTMNRDAWNYRWNAHALAAPGYVVTWINRHGSTGFGEKFARSILGAWGDQPLEDILRGTDHLLRQLPNLDPKRVAAAGGSYGGYMAAWAAGHTDRFACLINHAGVNDFITQYGADVTSYGFTQVLGGRPWDNPEGMQRNNPVTYARNFKTPMLLIHGEKDYRVPYGNATALYGIYQAMGLPSRLVIFPAENHWILTPQNSIYWYWEVQSWLARWIGGQPTLEKPAFAAPPAR